MKIDEPILIGPVSVGKTTVARHLGEKLGLPVVSMDDHRNAYYRELGFDEEVAKRLFDEDGAASVWCYFKAFDPHSVERLLEDYPGHIIDMGGGSSVHEHADQLARVAHALCNHRYVVLLLPYRDREESLLFLNARTGWSNEGRNVNRILLEHPSNYELATMTVYTEDRSAEEVAREICERMAGERHSTHQSSGKLAQFIGDQRGFLTRDGPAKMRGDDLCNKKLCFTCTEVEPLVEILYELSLRDDCFFVKLDAQRKSNGMVRGRCFLTSEAAIGSLWKQYKTTAHVFCTIQDDDFTRPLR